jgi:hypothetical protein
LFQSLKIKRQKSLSLQRLGFTRSVFGLCAVLYLAQLAGLSSVQARAPAPGLNWVRETGAEKCITSVELAKKVEHILGRPVFVSASEAELVIEGYVRPKKGRGFVAKLAVVDAAGRWLGSRDLVIDQVDCSALDEALALVIAVTINPQSGLAGESILSPEMAAMLDGLFSQDATEVAMDEQIAPSTRPKPTERRPKPMHSDSGLQTNKPKTAPGAALRSKGIARASTFYFYLGGMVGVGLQPGIAPGIDAEVAFETKDLFRMGVRATLSFPTEAKVEGNAEKKAGFRLFYLTPLVCPFSTNIGPHSISGCAGIMAGAIQSRPAGFDVSGKKTTKFVLNPTFEFRLKWALTDYLSPRLAVAAALPLIQHAFIYRSQAGETIELYRMGQIALNAELGLEVKY